MKIAIPTFGERISPRFDCACTILLLTIEDNSVTEDRVIDIGSWSPVERIDKLKNLEIDVLLCGGIDNSSYEQLKSRGIDVIPWITGNVSDVVLGFLNGHIEPQAMIGSGGRCCGRWRFRGRGRKRWQA